MSDCLLDRGYLIRCRGQAGSEIVYLANFVKNNVYVADTTDATGSYSAVADNGDGTIKVTTGAVHGLTVDQTVTLSAGAYDGNYRVVAVDSTTEFSVTAAFTATDTGTWAWYNQTEILIGTSDANGTALTFLKIEQESETANVKENDTRERANGSIVYEQSLALTVFEGDDITTQDDNRTLIDRITRGRFIAVVIGNDGVHKVYGSKNGLRVPEGTAPTGTALGDLSGYIFTLVGKEKDPAFIYDPTGSTAAPVEAFTAFTLPA